MFKFILTAIAAITVVSPALAQDFSLQSAAASGGTIESNIAGDFHGWDGETIYKLSNGQIWQQSSYHYHYHYAYAPEVLIYPSAGGYKMHVIDDDDEDISVQRLR